MTATNSDILDLTQAQLGIWYGCHLDPRNPTFNVAECVTITGPLEVALFRRAHRLAVRDTTCLNARPVATGDGARQMIDHASDEAVTVVDLRATSSPDDEAEAWMRADLTTSVDLLEDPLHHAALLLVAPGRALWYQRYHQFLMDGLGWSLFAHRVARRYRALLTGVDPELPPMGDLGRLLQEEAAYRESREFRDDRRFWLHRADPPDGRAPTAPVAGALTPTLLRTDGTLTTAARDAMTDLAAAHSTRWTRVLVALVAVYMSKVSASGTVTLGVPVPGRVTPLALSTPSRMSNVLPLSLSVTSSKTLGELVRDVSEGIRELLQHQRYRGEELRRELGRTFTGPRQFGPLVNIVPFHYDIRLGPCRTRFRNLRTGPVEDLAITFFDRRDARDVSMQLEAPPATHAEPYVSLHQRRIARYLNAARGLDADAAIGTHDVLAEDERRNVLVNWNSTATPFPSDRCLAALVDTHAKRTPDAPAVRYPDEELTYEQLVGKANRLANLLIRSGVRRGDRVATLVDGSAWLPVAFLGILKAGAAYVPLDTRSPAERVRTILEDAGCRLVIADDSHPDRVLGNREVLSLRTAQELLQDEPARAPAQQTCGDDPAYVMYTSGSTGGPKGVVVTQRGIARLVLDTDYTQVTSADHVGQVSNPAFDAITFEVWSALLNGGCLVGIPRETVLAPAAFAAAVRERSVTVLLVTMAQFREVARAQPDAFATLRVLLFGGEAADVAAVRVVLQHPPQVMVNGYGPTESTTFAVCHRFDQLPEPAKNVPIGRPIANTPCYVLDEEMRPVPVGTEGVLYVGGPGLAQEYLRRAATTAGSFVPDPFSGNGARLYRTGDRARWTCDGVIEYLGRDDDQIKVGGHRVEIGEIEAVLGSHPGVATAVVVAHRGNTRQLMGYVVLGSGAGDAGDAIASIRAYLRSRLPHYMVPMVSAIDRLPLTRNGKVDRSALPTPAEVVRRSPELGPLERLLLTVWRSVLGTDGIDIHDSFTALGGNSLHLAETGTVIQRTLRVSLPLSTLFNAHTVADLAKVIRDTDSAPGAVDKTAEIALSVLTPDGCLVDGAAPSSGGS